jgi:hypothetical protein
MGTVKTIHAGHEHDWGHPDPPDIQGAFGTLVVILPAIPEVVYRIIALAGNGRQAVFLPSSRQNRREKPMLEAGLRKSKMRKYCEQLMV